MPAKFYSRLTVLLLVVGLLGPSSAEDGQRKSDAGSGRGPRPAQLGLGPDDALRPSPGDHCPVCGMFPARMPRYASALVLQDGRTFYFCSNRCLLQSWRHSRTHLGVPPEAIGQMRVLDYFNGAVVDAHQAWWVAGSDAIGPMGPAVVALTSPKAVEIFRKRHGGSLVFQLHQVDEALWKKIIAGRDN
ncbi:MAG: nitrous oxide reductase accessory protein NosL [Desulfosarcinaceae bacterium]